MFKKKISCHQVPLVFRGAGPVCCSWWESSASLPMVDSTGALTSKVVLANGCSLLRPA